MLDSPSKKSSRVFVSSSSFFLVNERNNTSVPSRPLEKAELFITRRSEIKSGRMSIKRPLWVSMAASVKRVFRAEEGRWWKMEDEEKKEGVQPLLNEPFSFLHDLSPPLFAPIRGLNHGEKTLNTRDIFPWPEIGGHRCGTKEVVGLTRVYNTKIVENRGRPGIPFFSEPNFFNETQEREFDEHQFIFCEFIPMSLQFTRSKFCFFYHSQFSTISFY